MPIITRDQYPAGLDHPALRGVFIGGCIERGDGAKYHAKAHTHTSGGNVGWICYQSNKWTWCKELALHELAHVITLQGHTDKWRKVLLELGGTLDTVFHKSKVVLRSYQKRQRKA